MIELSPTAIGELKRLRSKHLKLGDGALRIGVESSGCAGLSYQMEFDQTVQPSDQVFDCGEIQVVIDPSSLPLVDGLTLDYTEDLMGGGFRFYNPNATQTCSCGHSFST